MSRMNDPMSSGGEGSAGEQARETASRVGQGLRDVGGQVSDAAREQYEQLREHASQYYEQGRQKAEEWQQNVEQYVHDQPVKSLLIAAGIGFLVGVIWKRS